MSSMQKNCTDKKNRLTTRQKEIIQILTRFSASRPVTVSMISEMMDVSSRTILREMPRIEQWMQENDFRFERKPGVGLILHENQENRNLILDLLEIESVRKIFTKEERKRRILGELLYAKEPLKSYYFLSDLHISEGTLSSDLDDISRWLEEYNIELVRRPGLGFFLQGKERDYRQVIANLLYETVDDNQIMQMLRGDPHEEAEKISVQNRVFGMIDREIATKIEEILLSTAKRLQIRYTDSAFIGLIVHISLAVTRIRSGEKIEMEPEKLRKLMMRPEFSIAEEITDQIKEAFQIVIPKDEIGFITMHLSSSRLWPADERMRCMENIDMRRLVRQMIECVESELHVGLKSERLQEDLCNHMAPALSRLAMGIPVENSQIDSIRAEYPEIMRATAKACELVCREVHLDKIPDAEIAYLAMHFGAAMERTMREIKTISVVVVCPTGVGTARILEAGLKKEFPNIHVVGVISAFQIDTEQLRHDGIDLIISTVHLDTDYPWICVSPILQPQDKRELESRLAAHNAKPKAIELPKRKQMTDEDIVQITEMGQELTNLTEHFRFDTLHTIRSQNELIAAAGKLFAENEEAAADIEEGLYERDRLADTYIKQLFALLLHCRTNMVQHARFGYLRMEPPLYENGHIILGAFVLLIPEDESPRRAIQQQLVGAVSGLLIEDKTLLDQLREGDWNGSRESLQTGLRAFYKEFLKKRIGVEWK